MVENNISYLKLKHSGEELLSFTLRANDDEEEIDFERYYLLKPAKMGMSIDPESGSIKIYLVEWIPQRISPDKGFEIRASDVLVMADVSEPLKKSYMTFCKKLESSEVFSEDEGGYYEPLSKEELKKLN